METEIIIAVVTSFASIAVAITSLVINKINNKDIRATNKAMESLKYEFDVRRLKFQIFDDNLKKRYNSIGLQIKHMQKCKDALTFLSNSSEGSLDSSVALEHFSKTAQELFQCYEEESIYLEKDELHCAHASKNIIIHAEHYIKMLLKVNTSIELSNKDLQFIIDTKSQLTDFQNQLRDKRMGLLADIGN